MSFVYYHFHLTVLPLFLKAVDEYGDVIVLDTDYSINPNHRTIEYLMFAMLGYNTQPLGKEANELIKQQKALNQTAVAYFTEDSSLGQAQPEVVNAIHTKRSDNERKVSRINIYRDNNGERFNRWYEKYEHALTDPVTTNEGIGRFRTELELGPSLKPSSPFIERYQEARMDFQKKHSIAFSPMNGCVAFYAYLNTMLLLSPDHSIRGSMKSFIDYVDDFNGTNNEASIMSMYDKMRTKPNSPMNEVVQVTVKSISSQHALNANDVLSEYRGDSVGVAFLNKSELTLSEQVERLVISLGLTIPLSDHDTYESNDDDNVEASLLGTHWDYNPSAGEAADGKVQRCYVHCLEI